MKFAPFNKICPTCSNEFLIKIKQKIPQVYCSYKCIGVARQKVIDKSCPTCGIIRKTRQNRPGYCSQQCYHASRTDSEIKWSCPIHGSEFAKRMKNRSYEKNICMECRREQQRKAAEELQDSYLKSHLLRNMHGKGLGRADIPQSMVELERTRLQLVRAIKEKIKS